MKSDLNKKLILARFLFLSSISFLYSQQTFAISEGEIIATKSCGILSKEQDSVFLNSENANPQRVALSDNSENPKLAEVFAFALEFSKPVCVFLVPSETIPGLYLIFDVQGDPKKSGVSVGSQ